MCHLSVIYNIPKVRGVTCQFCYKELPGDTSDLGYAINNWQVTQLFITYPRLDVSPVSSLWHTQGSMCHRSVLFNIPKVGCVTLTRGPLYMSYTTDRWHMEPWICYTELTGDTSDLGYVEKNWPVTHRALGSMCHLSALYNIPKAWCVTCQFFMAYPRLDVSPVSSFQPHRVLCMS
jgi:hypothetical protein